MDILVHVRHPDGESIAADVGLALAKRFDAYVYALYVAPVNGVAFSTPETVVFQAQETDNVFREAQSRRGWWQSRLDEHGVRGEWLVAQGEPVEAICHAARWCDLIVAQRPKLNPDAPIGWGTVSRTAFGSGTPLVVVPETAMRGPIAERILIAWNRSREAMRAVHGALPLLARAQQIVVLEGADQSDVIGARLLPRLDLARYLERHGVAAQFKPFPAKNDFGAGILDAARAMQADLIVMGAWGHSRISALVLGGTTRFLFQHSDLPLFVAH